jgi:hypothetical protein
MHPPINLGNIPQTPAFIFESKENNQNQLNYHSYVPEKNRILLSTSKYFQEHYIQEPYDKMAPILNKNKWLRPRQKTREINHKMKWGIIAFFNF